MLQHDQASSGRKEAGAVHGKRRRAVSVLFVLFVSLFFVTAITLRVNSQLSSLERTEEPRSATELLSLCTSARPNQQEYCEGYIDGSTLFWKYSTACASQTPGDRSFCEGISAAKEKIREAFEACQDCNITDFRPELKDDPRHVQLYMERMRKFGDEAKVAIGICSPGELHDTDYCAGYNAKAKLEVADLRRTYPGGESADALSLGLGDAAIDIGLHLWASEEFYEIQPCLQRTTGPRQVKEILLEFIQKNPEQQRGSTAIVVMAKALYYLDCPGAAALSQPHMEQCTRWDYYNAEFGTGNACDKTIVIRFMSLNHPQIIEHQLKPGEVFRTGLSRQQIGSGWWMFTACPIGYVSSVPLLTNLEKIAAGRYHCKRK